MSPQEFTQAAVTALDKIDFTSNEGDKAWFEAFKIYLQQKPVVIPRLFESLVNMVVRYRNQIDDRPLVTRAHELRSAYVY